MTKTIFNWRNRAILIACLAGVVMFSACRNGNGSGNGVKNKSPKDITTELYGCFAKGDIDGFIDKLVDNMSSETKKSINDEQKYKEGMAKEMKKALGKGFQKKIEELGGKLDFEVEEKIDGDKADVFIKMQGNDGQAQIMKFVKEDGKWKIAE